MPRSKRRKGVPKGQTVREQRNGGTVTRGTRQRRYYDPGENPQSRNPLKDLQKAARSRARELAGELRSKGYNQ